MPITYDETNDIWELTDPTKAEKESLSNIAIENIVGFFGEEVANKIILNAKRFYEKQVEPGEPSFDGDNFNTGEVGNA